MRLCFALLLLFSTCAHATSVFYTKGAANTRFADILPLSDGTFLLAGATDDLTWLPDCEKIALPGNAIQNAAPQGRIGFLMQVSGDLKSVRRVASLPPGAVLELTRIRSTNAPGQPTGALIVSGKRNDGEKTGYFLAKLNANFVDKAPNNFAWIRNIAAGGTHRDAQPWDVGGDGKIVYAEGEGFTYNWSAVRRLKADGKDDVVEDWRYHSGVDAAGQKVEGHWTPASSKNIKVENSAIVFKFWGRADLRSWTEADYKAVLPDGNGGTKQGRWPQDYYWAMPGNPDKPDDSRKGPGYTGYKVSGSHPTQQVGAIAVDRRNNHFYIGFSTKSVLPSGQPDFEPAVVAMTNSGALKWWSRLYTESPRNSEPDQWVDGLEVDYATNNLVVLARCHGNNTVNLWNGDKIASRPGAKGFKNGFTGQNGNIHIQWLGKFGLGDGTLRAATYVAEMTDNAKAGPPSKDALLDGWPDPNSGWPDVNTTRVRDFMVDSEGRVYIAATGRRTITSKNAFQKMFKPGEGTSAWNDFARVYRPDLSGIEYSSILSGTWKPDSDSGAGGINLAAIAPAKDGVFVIGANAVYTEKDVKDSEEKTKKKGGTPLSRDVIGKPTSNPMPTENIPSWGMDKPVGAHGVLALLGFEKIAVEKSLLTAIAGKAD
jgi:hypothetical protein